MASGPITSWQTDGETVADFIFLGFKITADGDCNHDIKRHLLLGRKVMTNLDNILNSRDITLSTKVHLVKVMVFPVVMYGFKRCYIQTSKKKKCSISGKEKLYKQKLQIKCHHETPPPKKKKSWTVKKSEHQRIDGFEL